MATLAETLSKAGMTPKRTVWYDRKTNEVKVAFTGYLKESINLKQLLPDGTRLTEEGETFTVRNVTGRGFELIDDNGNVAQKATNFIIGGRFLSCLQGRSGKRRSQNPTPILRILLVHVDIIRPRARLGQPISWLAA